MLQLREIEPTGLLNSTTGLRSLIIENPTLPLVVFAGDNCNDGDYSFSSCSRVNAYVGEFLDCTPRFDETQCFTDRDDLEEAVATYMAGDESYRSLPDAEFEALVKAQAAEYDPYWKPCIILTVNN